MRTPQEAGALRSKFAQALQLLRRYQARIEELGQVPLRGAAYGHGCTALRLGLIAVC